MKSGAFNGNWTTAGNTKNENANGSAANVKNAAQDNSKMQRKDFALPTTGPKH